MIGLFRRAAKGAAVDTAALGSSALALPLPSGRAVPPACVGVAADGAGRTRRAGERTRLTLGNGERAWCFHPGPYTVDLLPFAAAPEIGLRLAFAIDSPDQRVTQQRFDLFLASEAGDSVELAAFAQRIEGALQHELAQGNLDLPPCTSLDEWNAFRAGLNQLLYTRFGVTVDDCIPVDLGEQRDFARELLARAASGEAPPAAEGAAVERAVAQPARVPDAAGADALALRRLFLELPCVMGGLRLAAAPRGQELFRQQQALLQRLDLVSLAAATMPALELAAPGKPLAAGEQLRRARHSARAAAALDEAWALLARIERADNEALPALFDEADRIVANLEHDCAARRLAAAEGESA